jgi:hypothetical protein
VSLVAYNVSVWRLKRADSVTNWRSSGALPTEDASPWPPLEALSPECERSRSDDSGELDMPLVSSNRVGRD